MGRFPIISITLILTREGCKSWAPPARCARLCNAVSVSFLRLCGMICSGVKAMGTNDEKLLEIVQRIVEAAHPLRVILFGSMARDEAGPESDIDMLIIVRDGTHRFETTQGIYRNLRGLHIAVDVVVATESDVREYGDSPVLIYREALRDGRELYAA